MKFVRNVEVWVFGTFGALVAAACLHGPEDRVYRGSHVRTTPRAERVEAIGRAQRPERADQAGPAIDALQPMYIVYVVGKRPNAAQKHAVRASAL